MSSAAQLEASRVLMTPDLSVAYSLKFGHTRDVHVRGGDLLLHNLLQSLHGKLSASLKVIPGLYCSLRVDWATSAALPMALASHLM